MDWLNGKWNFSEYDWKWHNPLVFTIEAPIKENIKKTCMITNKQTGKDIEKPKMKTCG